MIKITSSRHSAIDDFGTEEWHGVDIEHYGKSVEWNNKKFLFRASENNKSVGYIEGKHESGVLYIETIIVASKYRGSGVGKMLMRKAENWGKKQKAHKAHLITGINWSASKFYESLGYHHVADLPDHHFHTTFVIYEKKL